MGTTEVKYARATVSALFDGQKVAVHRGEVWHASDPFVKSRPDLFTEEPVVVRGVPAAAPRKRNAK